MERHGVYCFGKVSFCLCRGFRLARILWLHILRTNYMLASIGIAVGTEERVRGGLKYKWRTGHSTPSPASALRQKS